MSKASKAEEKKAAIKTDTTPAAEAQPATQTPVEQATNEDAAVEHPPVENAPAEAPADAVPATSSFGFAPEATAPVADNERAYIEADVVVEGKTVSKKFMIAGRHFGIDGRDYTDKELALPENRAIIDRWLASGSGCLREVFE